RFVTCHAMKIGIQKILGFLLIFSCNKKNERINSIEVNPVLIKIGYYPTFHQPAEAILNLNEKYLIFYSPSSYNPARHRHRERMGKLVKKKKINIMSI